MSFSMEQWKQYADIREALEETHMHLKKQWDDPAGVHFQKELHRMILQMEELLEVTKSRRNKRSGETIC